MKTSYLIVVLSIIFFFSCTNASEEDLVDVAPIIEIVTYDANVKSIIDNNCIICHTNPPENDAPMSLLTYENVKEAVENSGLISRISSGNLGFLMPSGGPRLPQALIDIIIQWEENGLLEE